MKVIVPVTEAQQRVIKRIEAENFSAAVVLAKKLTRERFSPVYSKEAITSLRQYYLLPLFDPHSLHAISEELDPFWHAHILDTVRYKMMCDDIGYFMHHDPLDHEDTEKVRMVSGVYDHTYHLLHQLFEDVSETFFPRVPRMVCVHDVDLSRDLTTNLFPSIEMVNWRERYGHRATRVRIQEEVNFLSSDGVLST